MLEVRPQPDDLPSWLDLAKTIEHRGEQRPHLRLGEVRANAVVGTVAESLDMIAVLPFDRWL